MKTLQKIGDLVVYLIFVILAIVLIGYFCGIKLAIITSGSMEPKIHTGSLCFVNTNAKYTNIKEGDIIVFSTPNGDQVTHRAIAITPEGIETKGDANDVSDGITTTSENFGGIILLSIPLLGYVATYAQTSVGKIIVGIIIAGIIALCIVDMIFDGKEAEEECQKAQGY